MMLAEILRAQIQMSKVLADPIPRIKCARSKQASYRLTVMFYTVLAHIIHSSNEFLDTVLERLPTFLPLGRYKVSSALKEIQTSQRRANKLPQTTLD